MMHLTETDVRLALDEQRRTGARLGEILVEHDHLFEGDLARSLAELTGMPYRDLSLDPPDPKVLTYLPEGFCRRRGVLPVELRADTLLTAVQGPRDLQTLGDIRTLLDVPFVPPVAARGAPRQAIEAGYGSRLVDDGQPDDEGTADATQSAELSDGNAGDALAVEGNRGPVIDFVTQVLDRTVDERASDIHVEPTKDGLRIRFRVDGLLHDARSAPASYQLGVISRIKVMTDMDISDHRRPQDGRMSTTVRGVTVDVRAATMPTITGEAIVRRLLTRDHGLLGIDSLGFLPGPLELSKKSFRKAWGMVLVTGPTGSGKSTTLYSAINELNVPSRTTITAEDPIDYRVTGIKQTQVNAEAGYTFASGLRAALRADPDIILVGEIRDLETARIATEAALTGHLVLSTLHANDAASSTTRLIDRGLGPYLVTSALGCVVAQRPVRRLCPRCRSVSVATPEERLELDAMALTDGRAPESTLPRGQRMPALRTHGVFREAGRP
jgi:type IV pilus assembly protein PilB